MSWYYTSNGKEFGPSSATDVRAHITSGRISPADRVKGPGMTSWVPVTYAFTQLGFEPEIEASTDKSAVPIRAVKTSSRMSTSLARRIVLVISATLVAAVMLFPPYVIRDDSGHISGVGYQFLFDLPYRAVVNSSSVFTEIVAILVISLLLCIALKDSK
jgi:hypothetical protein